MLKKTFGLIIMIVLMMASGFFITGCSCGDNGYVVKVTFVNGDKELGLSSYQFKKSFNEPADISFDVLEGFDHSGIKGTINNRTVDYSVEFSNPEIEEAYEYSVKKTITYTIDKVSRAFELVIDLANVKKKTFEISLSNNLTGFSAVTVSEEQTKNLTVLNENNILTTRTFEDNKIAVNYGEYVILVYKKTNDVREIETLYSKKNRFSANVANIGKVQYSYYNVARRGNSNYSYNSDYFSRVYYLGKIQEDLVLQDTIPNYEEEKGFVFDKTPNTFYLMTNMADYSSGLLNVSTYSTTSKGYNSTNTNLDRVDGKVIEKNSADFNLNKRYDVHKFYIGADLDSDILLTTNEKNNLHKDLYVRIESELDIENINLYLLLYEKDKLTSSSTKSIPLDIISDKGFVYAKLTKDLVSSFCVSRSYVDNNGIVYDYKIGNAILYVNIDYDYVQAERNAKTFEYTIINLPLSIDSNIDFNKIDYHIVPYILNEDGSKDYGFVDYHYMSSHDIVYFRTDKLYNGDNYKNTLYLDVFGPDYVNYKNTTISNLNLYNSGNILNKLPLYVENKQEYNGVKDTLIALGDRHALNEYSISAKINLVDNVKMPMNIDFSNLELPNNLAEGIYITNKSNFSSLSDFQMINIETKDKITNIQLGSNQDIYYLVACNSIDDFEFDVYLNPVDKWTKVTITKDLYDIAGNPIVLEINGINYQIKVKYQEVIFELHANNFFAG